MSAQLDLSKLSVGQFAERFRGEMIPLSNTFSYFCASVPLTEEDVKEYLEEPIAALPAAIQRRLPKISIILVPYIQKGAGKGTRSSEYVSLEKPASGKGAWAAQLRSGNEEVLVFGLKDQDVAEYHYRFYQVLSTLLADRATPDEMERYRGLIRDEFTAEVHGEVDEESWRRKQPVQRRHALGRGDNKQFKEYVRQSFIDTLTLYLHGICCDIDVDTGPRQLPSRYLRKRLQLLREMFAPPDGYAVFPEEAKP